jgi:DMSO/TMAO reductase YedYZ molybdopterin-dependent catalytic subunit
MSAAPCSSARSPAGSPRSTGAGQPGAACRRRSARSRTRFLSCPGRLADLRGSGSLPGFDPKTWQLSLGGHVEKPTTISYHELKSLPKGEQVSTFHCVTGWTVKNVQWGGVRLGEVLALAQPKDVAHAIEFVSAEQHYVDYLTLKQAGLHDVMLAYEMNGKPLRAPTVRRSA